MALFCDLYVTCLFSMLFVCLVFFISSADYLRGRVHFLVMPYEEMLGPGILKSVTKCFMESVGADW